jgi:hypothetical protein
MSQLHKRFTSEQLKEFFDRYLKNEIKRTYIQEILKIKRRRFFLLLKQYKGNPQTSPSNTAEPKLLEPSALRSNKIFSKNYRLTKK